MRRHQTQITVWPAITDLMISIVVIAILVGIVGYISHTNIVSELNGRVETQQATISSLGDRVKTQQATISSLGDRVKTQQATISSLGDRARTQQATISSLQVSISVQDDTSEPDGQTGDIVINSCLGLKRKGLPYSLMTIQLRSSGIYSVIHNPIDTKGDFKNVNSKVKKYMNTVSHTNFTSDEMISYAETISEFTKNECKFYVTLEGIGVTKRELREKWTDLERYLSLTNPNVRW